MNSHDKSRGTDGDLDLDTVFATVRRNIGELGDNIETLRDEADALLKRAAGRIALAVLERPEGQSPDLEHLQNSIDALGRHSADIPVEFDPRPYDPNEEDMSTDDGGGAVGGDAMAFEDLVAAPAFEPELDDEGHLGAFEIAGGANPLDNDSPDTILAAETPRLHVALSGDSAHENVAQLADADDNRTAPGDDDTDHVAEVIAFTPRDGSDMRRRLGTCPLSLMPQSPSLNRTPRVPTLHLARDQHLRALRTVTPTRWPRPRRMASTRLR